MVKRHPLAAFFILTFLLSWSLFVPLALAGDSLTPPVIVATIMAGGFGPLVSALIVSTVTEGRAGLRSLWRHVATVRVGGRWYVFAIAIPIVLSAMGYLLYVLGGGTRLDPATMPPLYLYVPSLINVFLVGGGQEEPGWRGFALPRLQARFNALVASLILGAAWGLWHLPLFFVPGSSQAVLPLVWYLPHVVAMAIIFTWLFNNSQGSVFLAMLLHAGLNAATGWLPLTSQAGALHQVAVVTLLEWAVVVVLLLRYGPENLARGPRVVE